MQQIAEDVVGTKDADIRKMVAEAMGRWGRIDILHNNVGVSLSGGDAELDKIFCAQ